MKSTRVQPLSLINRPSKKRAQSATTTEVATRGSRGLIIAALHLVFASVRASFTATQLPTRRRPCGGPVIMIMQPVISDVGIPGMEGIRGLPGITGTDDAPLLPSPLVSRGHRRGLRREGQQRATARVRLLRGRAATQDPHQRRGAADRGEYCRFIGIARWIPVVVGRLCPGALNQPAPLRIVRWQRAVCSTGAFYLKTTQSAATANSVRIIVII
jgi:hypothetical protein